VCHALASENISTFGKQILIAGRSRHVGLPIAILLQGFKIHPDLPEIGEATISLAHRHTSQQNLIEMARKSDIIISATGVPGLIQESGLISSDNKIHFCNMV
jgi:methylenetetrahydrofolate dehydrogenase(NAD+)/5,10-methenyltetrahydrofolate cyclohydrolase